MYTSLSSLHPNTQPNNFMKVPKVWNASAKQPVGKTAVGDLSTAFQPTKASNAITPSVWGKSLWFSFHHGALYYPKNPTPEVQQNMLNFIKAIPLMIPCEFCRKHATLYIESKKSVLPLAVSSSEELFKFFWEFHNFVNKETNKRIFTLEETIDLYTNRPLDALR